MPAPPWMRAWRKQAKPNPPTQDQQMGCEPSAHGQPASQSKFEAPPATVAKAKPVSIRIALRRSAAAPTSLNGSLSQRKKRPVTMSVATVVVEPRTTSENWPGSLETKRPGQYQQQWANQKEKEYSTDCSPSVANAKTSRHPQLPGRSNCNANRYIVCPTMVPTSPPYLPRVSPRANGTLDDAMSEWIGVQPLACRTTQETLCRGRKSLRC